jgi:cytochrome c-type biogenesis protein
MVESVNLWIAFIGGLISFFSPCVVVLVPVFLANIAGVNLHTDNLELARQQIRRSTWLFVLGFTVTFAIFGSVSGLLAAQFVSFERYFSIIAGVLIVFFGLVIADVIKINALYRTVRLQPAANKDRSRLYPLLMGIGFAAGWTPCVGPILAAILLLAGESGSALVGTIYLIAYSIGLMIPFILVGTFIEKSRTVIQKLTPHLGWIKYISAAIIIALGLLLATGNLGRILSYFYFL